MTEPIPRAVVDAFYAAYAAGDAKKVGEYLADDVQWSVSGPVDVLPFCGARRGKPAVMDFLERLLPSVLRIFSYDREVTVIEDQQLATLSRVSARRTDGRVVSYRSAHFVRFRDGKVATVDTIIDSYDAAEQVLGHSLTELADTDYDASLVPI
jgi:ketosteroid isomerase-like protein